MIQGHEWRRGVLLYNVKWDGYAESENTLEPEENLLPGAREALAAYHRSIGGAPVKPVTGAKKRKSTTSLKQNVSERKRARRTTVEDEEFDSWLPKEQTWDRHIDAIETIQRDEFKRLLVFIRWNNGKRTKIGIDMVYKHCPLPMLKFYEGHLKFN